MDKNISIISEVFKGAAFSDYECSKISSEIEKVVCKKNDIILKTSEVVHHQYFVYEGCLRAFFTDKLGKEHTIQFAVKDWWISDFTAFFTNTRAIMSIECIQNAVLYKVSKKSMARLYLDIPKLETFFRKKMEGAFAGFQKRILANLALTAKERYLSFIDTYPSIEQSVKNYHIASYLGITTESLSRIRKEIAG